MKLIYLAVATGLLGLGVNALRHPMKMGGMRSFASAEEWKQNPEKAEMQQKAVSYLLGVTFILFSLLFAILFIFK